jgi:hypothetical protein
MKKLFTIPSLLIIAFALYAFGGKKDCPPEGQPNPKKGKNAVLKSREKGLNKHINRETSPQPGDFDNDVTIQGMYDSKDDSIYNEDKAASITGYFFRAVDIGMESCNCYTEDKSKYSTNIYISPTPINKQTRTADCIVAVITPYSRSLNPKDWDTENINEKFVGKKIKVSGWLIYNFLKGNLSIETNPNSAQPERRTIWGICPMTDLKSLDSN